MDDKRTSHNKLWMSAAVFTKLYKKAFEKDPKKCPQGHALTPENVFGGAELRAGVLNCKECARVEREKKRTVPQPKIVALNGAADKIVKQLEIPQLLKVAALSQRVMTLVAAKAAELAAAPRRARPQQRA